MLILRDAIEIPRSVPFIIPTNHSRAHTLNHLPSLTLIHQPSISPALNQLMARYQALSIAQSQPESFQLPDPKLDLSCIAFPTESIIRAVFSLSSFLFLLLE